MFYQSLKPIFSMSKSAKRLAGCWFLCCSFILCTQRHFELLAFAQNISPFLLLWGVIASFLIFSAMDYFFPESQVSDGLLGISAVVYAWLLIRFYTGRFPYFFYIAVMIALGFVLVPLLRQSEYILFRKQPSKKLCIAVIVVCGLFFTAIVGGLTCLRYMNYIAPNYDFGIFCNMFYHMKSGFLPLSTCERDTLLSHFAVHISPIYYLLLPFYFVFPSPLTLQIGQAVVLASGLIPLYILARKYGLSNKVIMVMSVIYVTYPALSTGCFYDIHENCFLTPLLLWLFALYETGRFRWMLAAVFGVLLVKEDAAVYIGVFALYIIFSRKDKRLGAGLICIAFAYFSMAILLLEQYGQGAMFNRYGNLISGGGGILSIFETLLRNPGFFLTQLYTTTSGDNGKWLYMVQLLAPFAVLLFTTRKHSRYLLLLPLLLNLLTTNTYQYDIGYQYSFGISAFLWYLVILNSADLPSRPRRNRLVFSAVATCLMFTLAVLPQWRSTQKDYRTNGTTYRQMDKILDTVPRTASVTASCMLVPHLAGRDVIYEAAYHAKPDTDYVVLDIRPGYESEAEPYVQTSLSAGYEIAAKYKDMILILKKAN